MRILYVVKDDPRTALGHAAERARNFLRVWRELNISVTCVFPAMSSAPQPKSPEYHGLTCKRGFFEKVHQYATSYHFRQAGPTFIRQLRELPAQKNADFIVCEELTSADLALRTVPGARVIYVAHNVESLLMKSLQAATPLAVFRRHHLRRRESEIIRECAMVFCFSNDDREKLRRLTGREDLRLTRAGCVQPRLREKPTTGNKILFVGALDYFPNIEALRWYAGEIHPRLGKELPVLVVGRNPSAEVETICHRHRFELVRSPADMEPFLRQGALSIVPLLSASGTRGKILEAAMHELPVISTTLGAEGLGFEKDRDLLTADTAEAFALEMRRLLESPALGARLAAAARERAEYFLYERVVDDFTAELKEARAASR